MAISLVAWTELTDRSPIVFEAFAQVMGADGSLRGNVIDVFDDIDGFDGSRLDVAPLASSGFAVAATSEDGAVVRAFRNSGQPRDDTVLFDENIDRNDIHLDPVAGGNLVAIAQQENVGVVFDRFGSPTGDTFSLFFGALQSGTTLADMGDGRTLAVASIGTTGGGRLVGAYYNEDGIRTQGPFFVSDLEDLDDVRPDITPLGDGRALVVWVNRDSAPNVGQARIIGADGTPETPEVDVTFPDLGSGQEFNAQALEDGNVVIAWSQSNLNTEFSSSTANHQVWITSLSDDVDEPTNGFFGGTAGKDVVFGSEDEDRLSGGQEDDILHGNGGDDDLLGRRGKDFIDGGDGADDIIGGNGGDSLYGGEGNDTLSGGRASDLLVGEEGNDNILGGRGADTMYGGLGDDTLSGNRARDLMNGGEGDDLLRGGSGRDTLQSSVGQDTLIGGSDEDTFEFIDREDTTMIIADFNVSEDLLDISDAFFFSPPTVESFLAHFAEVEGNDLRLTFNDLDILLQGITDTAALESQIII